MGAAWEQVISNLVCFRGCVVVSMNTARLTIAENRR